MIPPTVPAPSTIINSGSTPFASCSSANSKSEAGASSDIGQPVNKKPESLSDLAGYPFIRDLEDDVFWSVDSIAKHLDVCRSTVWRWVSRGLLKPVAVVCKRHQQRFSRTDVLKAFKAGKLR